jgi:MASE1 protein
LADQKGPIKFGALEVIIIALSSAIYAVLGVLSASFVVVPGLPLFYAPEGFILPATLWFGGWAGIGAFFGTVFASPFYGQGYDLGVLYGLCDLVVPFVGAFLIKKFKADIGLRNIRSLAIFVLFGTIVNVIIEAFFGDLVSYGVGFYTFAFAMTIGIATWFVGSFTGTLVIGGILLRALTPYFEKSPLFSPTLFKRRQTRTPAPPPMSPPPMPPAQKA